VCDRVGSSLASTVEGDGVIRCTACQVSRCRGWGWGWGWSWILAGNLALGHGPVGACEVLDSCHSGNKHLEPYLKAVKQTVGQAIGTVRRDTGRRFGFSKLQFHPK
jgi:hypothetical protein